MRRPQLLRSLRDLAIEKASAICSPNKPYFDKLADVFEQKLFDEFVEEILDRENGSRVRPSLQEYCKKSSEIPFPFTVNGKDVKKIRKDLEYLWAFDVSRDEDTWHFLDNKDCIRLFDALDVAGLLSFDE